MFTLNGIRNAFYCAIAFGIVACATAPMAYQADVDAQRADSTARAKEQEQPVGEAARNEDQDAQAQRLQAQAESQRLAAQLEDMQVSQTARGIVLTLQDVSFNTGRAQLKPGAERSLDQVASFLNRHPERRLQIEGFTDSEGTDDYNIELSQSRADTVAHPGPPGRTRR